MMKVPRLEDVNVVSKEAEAVALDIEVVIVTDQSADLEEAEVSPAHAEIVDDLEADVDILEAIQGHPSQKMGELIDLTNVKLKEEASVSKKRNVTDLEV